ncbi:MAG: hypothetical protein EBV20_09790 [Betaproteobacteria bacterium]|jgi:hypothetical protein|nr:hypothetical protein [Betaproteobacteria bacterium]NBP45559.1 hypothetical protein [Betaproteobacteria bacterium]
MQYVLSFLLLLAPMAAVTSLTGCSGEPDPKQSNRQIGPDSKNRLGLESSAQANTAKQLSCYGQDNSPKHIASSFGRFKLVCDPHVGWTNQPQEHLAEYAPTKLYLNDKLVHESLIITEPELVKKKDGFEYWVFYWGEGGNACESWSLVAMSAQGYRLYEDIHQCTAWEGREPHLIIAGLNVRDESPAVETACEPYLKVVPSRIKIKNATVSIHFVKHADPDLSEQWEKRIPPRYRKTNWMPYGCLINDYDGVVVVYTVDERQLGYGLYLTESEAFPTGRR